MRASTIDSRRLGHFLAVFESGGVREASRRIRIAQPALSRTIAELEEELGLTLFLREGRRIVPTEAAQLVAEDARRVLRDLEALVARAHAVAGGSEGRLRVGTSPSATFHEAVPGLLRAYRARRPHVAVEVVERPSSELVAAVSEHGLDVAFVRPGDPLPPTLWARELARERLVIAVSDGHAMAGLRRVSLDRVLAEPLLLPPEGSGSSLSRWIREAARERDAAVRVAAHVSHAASLVHLAAAGMGVAIVPESLTTMRTDGVAYIPLATRSRLPLLLVAHQEGAAPPLEVFLSLAEAGWS